MKKNKIRLISMVTIFAMLLSTLIHLNPLTIYAKESYKVEFMDGSKVIGTIYVDDGDIIQEPYYEKEGYQLSGWYADEALNNWFDFSAEIHKNTKIYAEYVKVWKITFDLNGGSENGLENPRVERDGYQLERPYYASLLGYSNNITPPPGKAFNGLEINGTQWQDSTYTLKSDIVIKVLWYDTGITQYQVKFDLDGGKMLGRNPENVNAGGFVTQPSDPSKSGHKFMGWYEDYTHLIPFDFENTKINDNMTIYAKFIEEHKVTFDLDGGYFYSMSSDPWTAINGEELDFNTIKNTIIANTTAPDNKEFDAFEVIISPSTTGTRWDSGVYKVNSNITLKVLWKDSTSTTTHEVKFDLDGGTINNVDTYSVNVGDGKTVSKPVNPEKSGYRFEGWYKDPDFKIPFVFANESIKAPTTIYAKYNKEYIVMVYNGAVTNLTDNKAIEGEIVTIKADDPPSKKVFDRWDVLGNYTIVFDDVNASITTFKMIAQDVEIEPIYKPDPAYIEYTITYNENGGTKGVYWNDTYKVVNGYDLHGLGNTPYPETVSAPRGKEFKGVEITDKNGKHVILSGSSEKHTVVSDTEIKYLWQDTTVQPIQHTITVVNGTANKKSAEKNTPITIIANPAPRGKEFDVWIIEEGTIILDDKYSSTTTFTMPDEIVRVKATYKDITTTTYTILEGENQTYIIGSNKDVIIRSSGQLANLGKIRIDGIDLDSKDYEVENGSTILTLKAAYLNTLTVGNHTVEFLYSDGSARTILTIAKNNNSNSETNKTNTSIQNNTNNPKTGDDIMINIIVLLSALLGIAGTVTYLNKKKIN